MKSTSFPLLAVGSALAGGEAQASGGKAGLAMARRPMAETAKASMTAYRCPFQQRGR